MMNALCKMIGHKWKYKSIVDKDKTTTANYICMRCGHEESIVRPRMLQTGPSLRKDKIILDEQAKEKERNKL